MLKIKFKKDKEIDYLKKQLIIIKESNRLLSNRVSAVEDYMQSTKIDRVKKNLETDKKRRWLNGYPDDKQEA